MPEQGRCLSVREQRNGRCVERGCKTLVRAALEGNKMNNI